MKLEFYLAFVLTCSLPPFGPAAEVLGDGFAIADGHNRLHLFSSDRQQPDHLLLGWVYATDHVDGIRNYVHIPHMQI